ncbi:hypothetical protein ACFYM7_20890 [Streptomyces cyaneofuscatus]|uniref:hypothetical protein n=1 Tax=Streptomyces cyaneofuscatus TaxID=66883 RepID=UPI00369FDDA4
MTNCIGAPPPPTGPNSPDASDTAGGAGERQDNGRHDVLALRAELERLRHEHAPAEHGRMLAEAEAGHLRVRLALRALMLAPERAALHARGRRPVWAPPGVGAALFQVGVGQGR